MKQILIALITFYQDYIAILLCHMVGSKTLCRYSPTCSQYAKEAILKKGAIIGIYLAVLRILSCQPFFNPSSLQRRADKLGMTIEGDK